MKDLIFRRVKAHVPDIFLMCEAHFARYKAVLSAKSLTLSGRFFVYARKRIGPRTEVLGV